MQNIRIIDLNTNDIIKFQLTTKEYKTSHTGIVTRVYAKNEGMQTKWYADAENANGKKFTINDNYDFMKVNEPFIRKVDMVHQPPHYQFDKFNAHTIIEAVGKTYKSASVFYHVGNALKCLMRSPRKNGLEDLKKAKWYLERTIEKWK
ncbi:MULTISPECIES: DUF3310 domain-containing protein [Staphylococcus]|uniref:DUF3310 domain-containing protein n=1 Tax=Staphylococcus TaxID=1279 RepID=UPI001F5BF69F|nr:MULTISPECIES: DUF3310 domain-containing protein [Staphylococcus]